MTKRILILGLGNFGFHLAQNLSARPGLEIYALERQKEARDQAEDFATCFGGNLENPETLHRCLEKIQDVDTAIVCLGTSTSAISLTALQLRKHESVRRVIIKVEDQKHEELLKAIDQGIEGEPKFFITNPEVSAASNIAEKILHENLGNRVELANEICLAELPCPARLANKMLSELDLRQTWNITVIGFQDQQQKFQFAGPDSILIEGNTITVVGHNRDLETLSKEQ